MGHKMDFGATTILDKTSGYWDVVIKEAIEIQLDGNNFNRDGDLQLSTARKPAIRDGRYFTNRYFVTDNNALSESVMRISYRICHEIAKELKTFNEDISSPILTSIRSFIESFVRLATKVMAFHGKNIVRAKIVVNNLLIEQTLNNPDVDTAS
ncbi:hypothetical protein ANN_20788 [Periplaneta americana]|uniref:Uncharacterized protein n=1 Tax=Periplaneta americana TaxID=6978 RepID=A0ABQ8SEV3_PERAM|nr:hypothetical protein ANN_20788 [Periplaneta americana]